MCIFVAFVSLSIKNEDAFWAHPRFIYAIPSAGAPLVSSAPLRLRFFPPFPFLQG